MAVVSVRAPTLVSVEFGEEQLRTATVVDGVEVVGALSPSRAADFKTCALKYRFRTVDRLPEAPSRDALRGTVVHKVLEDLFDLPAGERTPERAEAMRQDGRGLA